ncbi:polysaccharide biosynthesis/export family protein [Vibrio parahaemolyticus]|uniref:polysaccharide biosynthesis/export family protein n=1 Tax=Vibrio parahaemolyticus TaxID=670 RepID=UPI001121FB57|nr:polysaccharide biosynthesis/export family protein [Vibrio parahaemolyticus]ELA9322449.1 polysaccharide biosynthesis/export family protein [Vibrio parahaemolyticus]ELB2241464.1 polysaccharide biosynthesis/export family protein [Vibrio parahaemolyticus]MBM5098081.1 polysaccharide biosynthesis/export family protein [Vibrio parahaemolyticus]MBM5101974.1 polysaccharide biosynthesis/export family protein [Vibrio parahaemolyticus]MDF5471117.1 polysaccharide biosynthesis/export family protein [Vibr
MSSLKRIFITTAYGIACSASANVLPETAPSQSLNLATSQPTTATQIQQIPTTTPNMALTSGQYNSHSRQGALLPGEVDVRKLLPSGNEATPPPFGANLFAGGYETERVDGLSDNYVIAPGDKLSIWLWGAVAYADIVTVDNQGNIFIPNIGPIRVGDQLASNVASIVEGAIRKTYTKNVEVYVNLLTSTPVSVYVTGSVIRPGQYAGMAADSILYYLKRAGGIDSARGSYRHIKVIRDGKEIKQLDLYDFLQNGIMPIFSFKDKDVILVEKQGPTVSVSGSVRNPFLFEFSTESSSGEELAKYAQPRPKTSHVGIVGNRASGPFSLYLSYDDYRNFVLQDGDKLLFNDDLHAQVFDIEVAGSYLGPSYYAVKKKTRLHDLLNNIEVEPELADFRSVYILRKSVAEQQKERLEESLHRLERSVFTAPASSDGEAKIRAQEAQMVMQFVDRARKVQPLGKVVVSDSGKVANILLEQGDKVVIPIKTDLISISGEVLMPQAVVFNSNATIQDYVAWAGGFTERADDDRIAVVRANGLVEFGYDYMIKPGDQILVLPKVDAKTMQAVKDITQIIYQIAVAANVAIN